MAGAQSDAAAPGGTLRFSTDDLPAGLSEQERFDITFRGATGSRRWDSETVLAEDQRVAAEYALRLFGGSGIVRSTTNLRRWYRMAQHIAQDKRDAFQLGFNINDATLQLSQNGREATQMPGEVYLISSSEPLDIRAKSRMSTILLSIPGEPLRQRLANPDDFMLRQLDPNNPALRHLRRYMQFLLNDGDATADPALTAQIDGTLIDLVALALGASADSAALARLRGLRQARLHEVLSAIRSGYGSPTFSAATLSRRLGLSERYIHTLLQETGSSLTERVTELRLQRARTMLDDMRHQHLQIIEVALECGFSDVSYFNRLFRRRFGLSPRQARSGARMI